MRDPAAAAAAGGEEDADLLISKIQWNDVSRSLKGRTTFETPVVTQEVLLESLRATSVQLLHVTAEHNVTKRHVSNLLQDNEMLKEAVDTLNTQVNALGTALKKTNARMAKAEEYMSKAGDPDVLGSLHGRLGEIEAHKEFIVQLGDLFGRVGTLEAWHAGFAPAWQQHQQDYAETKAWAAATEDWIVEQKAAQDEAIDADELKRILDELQAGNAAATEQLAAADARLGDHDEALAQRATLEAFTECKTLVDEHDKTFSQVTALAQGMTDKLEHAANEVERMAERVDLNGERVDELYDGLEAGTLGGGITPEEVEEKIEAKYTLIVDQLESAIRSATEDEDEFRRIANDLQDMVRKMQMGKADKREMAEVREKLMVDGRLREQVDTLRVLSDMKVSHEEAERMLSSKASRRELKQSLKRLSGDVDLAVTSRLEAFEDATAGPAFGTVESLSKSSSRGSTTLCLGCNRRLDKADQLGKTNAAAHPHDASRRLAGPGSTVDGGSPAARRDARNQPHITHLGPGGAALGGGFQVRAGKRRSLADGVVGQGQHPRRGGGGHGGHGSPKEGGGARNQAFHELPPEYSLPQIDPRLSKPATFVMGTDGRVYPGQRKQQLHTFNLGRSASTGSIAPPQGAAMMAAQAARRTPKRVNIGGGLGGGPETHGGGSPFVTQVRSSPRPFFFNAVVCLGVVCVCMCLC